MKIITAIIKTFLGMTFIAFCAIILVFFIAIFYTEGVVCAVELFKSILTSGG